MAEAKEAGGKAHERLESMQDALFKLSEREAPATLEPTWFIESINLRRGPVPQ